MSYAAARKAKTKTAITAKVIGHGTTIDYKAGKTCMVQRNPSNPGMFIVYFSKTNIAQVEALNMPTTIEYLDGKAEGVQ